MSAKGVLAHVAGDAGTGGACGAGEGDGFTRTGGGTWLSPAMPVATPVRSGGTGITRGAAM